MRPVQPVSNHADHCARPWRAIEGMALHGLPRKGAAMILIALSQCHSLRRAAAAQTLGICESPVVSLSCPELLAHAFDTLLAHLQAAMAAGQTCGLSHSCAATGLAC